MINNSKESSKRLKVLLVDEDVKSLEFLGNILQECKYHVSVVKCKGGEEALLKLHENKEGYNMVITASCMANMDGFQLLHQIHDMDLCLPVIFFSHKDELEDEAVADQRKNALEQGACYFIIKPDHTSMVELIWKHIFNDTRLSENLVHSQKQQTPEANYQQRHTPKEVENEEEGEGGNPRKKQRFIWTPALKEIFNMAIDKLGGCTRAVPKTIHEFMREHPDVPSTINRQHISSYLQKYRKSNEKGNERASIHGTSPVYIQPSSNAILGPNVSQPFVPYGTNNPMQILNPELSAGFEQNRLCYTKSPSPHFPQPSHGVIDGGVTRINNSVMDYGIEGTVGMSVPNDMQCSETRLMPQQQPTLGGFAPDSINTSASQNNPLSSLRLPLRQNVACSFSPNPTFGLDPHIMTNAGGHDLMHQNGFAGQSDSFGFENCYESVIPQFTGSQPLFAHSFNGNFNQENNTGIFENRNYIGDAEAHKMYGSCLNEIGDLQLIVNGSSSQQHN